MADTEIAEVSAPVRVIGRPFAPGVSGNPGGIPKRIQQFTAVLEEHATLERTRALFDRMRALAMGELEVTKHTAEGEPYTVKLPPDAAFAKLYLDRVYGPVKERDLGPALQEALAGLPDDVLVVLRRAA